ncbi:MAG: urea ABC transporter permease subunit UrtB [Candidatus Rokubacteria bacterium GWC2_70_16]|nr:MAG: urea ABC transporter permease subunit UrtB [Candidatus Rokubacteria bacterium GWC2_70_16]OGL16525.1 MAG: urea ABC transporter permease subunit UrtB [Candidatus Rokubacteria bacterium RIFCSPLOWO2_12_FULL_71_19]
MLRGLRSLLLAVALLPGPFAAPAAAAAPPPAAPAAELAKHLADVASKDPAVQEAAAVALGRTGDRKILPLLEALREGSVHVWARPGRRETVIVGDKVSEGERTLVPLFGAYGREPITGPDGKPLLVDLAELEEVSAGRSLRLALRPLIDAFSGRSQLADPDPQVRRAAATKMGNAGVVAAVPALTEALGREGDRWARHAMEEALALIGLSVGEDAARAMAAARLGALRSVGALDRLREVAAEGASAAAVRQAAAEAVKRIERWSLVTTAVELGFQGLSLSSILLLMALGLAIVFGLMGVINMAHGELMALGAYATFVMQGWFRAHLPGSFDYYFLAALPFSFLVAGAAGFALERGVIRHLYGRPLETLLLTWGVSLIIQQGLRGWFGAANVDVTAPRWLSGGIPVAVGVQLPYNRLFIIVLAAVCVGGMYLLLFRTAAGLRIRAVTQNRGMAACLGVRARWVDAGTFALGAGLAGLAGCALTQIGNVGPELGQNYIVDSFMVVVTGGVGKLLGSILAAVGIGGLNKVIEPSLGAVYGKVLILVAVILFIQRRPSGLFAVKGRHAEA